MKISQNDVCRVAGITPRQYQYWGLKKYVNGNNEPGKRRQVGLPELMMYVAMSRLKGLGFSIQSISKKYLEFLDEIIYGVKLDDGTRDMPVFTGGAILFIDSNNNLICNLGVLRVSHEMRIVMEFDEILTELGYWGTVDYEHSDGDAFSESIEVVSLDELDEVGEDEYADDPTATIYDLD